jgi:prevent-host-death family protein
MDIETIDISEARNQFTRLDERLRDEHVVQITRHGKPVFAVVDIEYLTAVLETIEIMSDPASYKMFMESLEDIKHGRVFSQDDVRRELLNERPQRPR